MGEGTKIEWAHHTFNPWYGCTKISPACDHCYAEAWAKRSGLLEDWGKDRRAAAPSTWKGPRKWAKAAAERGVRERVFGPSLGDPFDNQIEIAWLLDYLEVIHETRGSLDYLLLTKRPQNIRSQLELAACVAEDCEIATLDKLLADWLAGKPPSNIWLGTTVENQPEANRRIPEILKVPAAVHFLSCEPLLGEVDLTAVVYRDGDAYIRWNALTGEAWVENTESASAYSDDNPRLDWVICGGESGPKARPMHPDWARSLRDQCAAADVPFFFKQWGEWEPYTVTPGGDLGAAVRAGNVEIVHPTGQSHVEVSEATGGRSTIPGSRYMERVGKKAAGRLLDGREHNDFPPVAQASSGEPSCEASSQGTTA